MTMKSIFFWVILLFSIFGFILFCNIIHERIHIHDFEDIAKNSETCILNWDGILGSSAYHSFYIKNSDEEIYNSRIVKSEVKAYTIQIGMFFIFLICLWYFMKEKFENETGRN